MKPYWIGERRLVGWLGMPTSLERRCNAIVTGVVDESRCSRDGAYVSRVRECGAGAVCQNAIKKKRQTIRLQYIPYFFFFRSNTTSVAVATLRKHE